MNLCQLSLHIASKQKTVQIRWFYSRYTS